MNLAIASFLLGSMIVTSYRSVPQQTDDSPYHTSTGEHVHPHGVAVSRNLLKRWGGPLDYGDLIFIEGVGFKRVNDCMHERFTNQIDVWLGSYKEEKEFDKRFRGKKWRIWAVHGFVQSNSKDK